MHETPDGEQFERWTGVYDPFVGSGTTIIAAEMTGRVCHAIEIDPAYADVAVKHWQDFTGETSKLETSGESSMRSFQEKDPLHNRGRPIAQADAGRPLPARPQIFSTHSAKTEQSDQS